MASDRDQALDLVAENEQQAGSASLAGSLVGVAKSFATWGLLYAAATQGFNISKAAAISKIAQGKWGASKGLIAAAKSAEKAKGGVSLSRFLEKAGTPVLGEIGGVLHSGATDRSYRAYKRWREGKTVAERAGVFAIDGPRRDAIVRGVITDYAKETAIALPFFYTADRLVGGVGEGASERQKERVPLHKIPGDFVSYIPEYFALDVLGRGVMHGAKGAYQALQNSLTKGGQGLPGARQSLETIQQHWKRPDNVVRNLAREIGIRKRAASKAWDERNRMFLSDNDTISKLSYANSPDKYARDFYRLYQAKVGEIKRLKPYNKDKEAKFFGRFLSIMRGRTDEQKAELARLFGTTGDAKEFYTNLERNLYDTKGRLSGSERFIMKVMGLERARLRHFDVKTQARVAKDSDAFIQLLNKQVQPGNSISEVNKRWKRIFRRLDEAPGAEGPSLGDLLADKHVYTYKDSAGKQQILDLRKGSPGYLLDRTVRMLGKLTRVGPSLETLYPIRGILGNDLPMMITVDKTIPLVGSKASITDEGLGSAFFKGQAPEGEARMAFEFKGAKGSKAAAPGVLLRDPGKSTYTLYGTNAANTETVALAKGMRPISTMLSKKTARMAYQLADYVDPVSQDTITPKTSLGSWLYEKFDLGQNTGMHDSVFTMLGSLINRNDRTKLSYIFSPHKSAIAKLTPDEILNLNLDEEKGAAVMLDLIGAKTVMGGIEKEAYDKVLLKDSKLYQSLLTDEQGNLLIRDLEHVINRGHGSMSAADFVHEISNDPRKARDVVQYLTTVEGTLGQVSKNVQNRSYIENHILNQPEVFLAGSGRGETPHQKMLRYIADVSRIHESSVSFSNTNAVQRALSKVKAGVGSRYSKRDLALVEMLQHTQKWHETMDYGDLSNLLILKADDIPKIMPDKRFTDLVALLQDVQNKPEAAALLKQSNPFKRYNAEAPSRRSQLHFTNAGIETTPYVLVENDFRQWGRLSSAYVYETFGTAMDWVGLGWDRGKYKRLLPKFGEENSRNGKSILGLWGRRALLAAGVETVYDFLDTFTDTTPMFEGTMLDEGVTVGIADQAVRVRMAASRIYDTIGVTSGAKYLEGLMPKSTSVLPGAIMGFALGGVPGAGVGAILNRYLQPQLAETPFSALGIIPVLAPFTMDLTKDHDELEKIYSGEQMVPIRKGKGWTFGSTPIEGGRTEVLAPNWYARLKSQAQAGPVQYGSPWEEFIFKDRTLLDFSIGDLFAPQYLTYKHYYDRPYVEPDVPFSEVPLIGPVLGATVGRFYNWIHPFSSNELLHADELENAFQRGVSGRDFGGHGSDYMPGFGSHTGINGAANGMQVIPGIGLVADEYVNRSHDFRGMLSEQVYRGLIEAPGLTGFITSQVLWGGDEPFADEAYLASASEIDSTARRMWDANIGDALLLNEGIRRLYPRPRTSYEKVNPLRNRMPNWLPEEYQYGDPYCVTPETEIETYEGLKRADEIHEGDLLRTRYGRWMPVSAIIPRPVEEKIYRVYIRNSDAVIRVTGDHPLLVRSRTNSRNTNESFKDAKIVDSKKHVGIYPTRDLTTTVNWLPITTGKEYIRSRRVVLSGSLASVLGILHKYGTLKKKGEREYIQIDTSEIPSVEVDHLLKTSLNANINAKDRCYHPQVVEYFKQLQTYGIPDQFYKAGPVVLLQYLQHFITEVITTEEAFLQFDLPNRKVAYQVWTHFIQNQMPTTLFGNTIRVFGPVANTCYFLLHGETDPSFSLHNPPDSQMFSKMYSDIEISHPQGIVIDRIEEEDYEGLVYGFEVDSDDTFCVAHLATHNTKRPLGEYILPGSGYEATHDITIDFPTGASKLGQSAYDQALSMVGLGGIDDEDVQEILEGGTAIHRMVQQAMKQQNMAVKTEALITDPKNRLSSYVDVVTRDMRGNEIPLEIKTISAEGFENLNAPKYANLVQLNAYMHMMNAKQGKLLYINRDDPTQVRAFDTNYSANMWDETVSRLNAAREMAKGFLAEGYGDAAAGYSYADRFEVLLSAAPFSREFREVGQIVEQQAQAGLLTEEQLNRLKNLSRQTKGIINKYEMYDPRFKGMRWMSPDPEYNSYNMNENIKAAAEYTLPERLVGAVWETAMSYRSPLHTKLFGIYSPEEMYENEVIVGKGFQGWGSPVESFIRPWSRGLVAADDPIQGALSYGTGGMILGGPVGAMLGGAFGAVYGTVRGAYERISGNEYTSNRFQELSEYSEYFDAVKYDRASRMYELTGDTQYLRQMSGTAIGYGVFEQDPETMSEHSRYAFQAHAMMGHPNKGHKSPWGGQNADEDIDFNPQANLGMAFRAMPYWDRPFFTAFLNERDPERREDILQRVDPSMARILSRSWADRNQMAFDAAQYWSDFQRPRALDPIMHPAADIDLFEMKTVEAAGLDAHDFGLGWREQVKRAEKSLVKPRALDINKPMDPDTGQELDPAELQNLIEQQFMLAGLNVKVMVRDTPSIGHDSVRMNVTIQRESSREVARKYNGR